MAIFGPLETVQAQLTDPRFGPAFRYAADALNPSSETHRRIIGLAGGGSHRQELGEGMFAIEAAYTSKPRPEGFFESHRKYIDVQVVVAGAERMEVEDIERLEETAAYDAEKDLIKYADTPKPSVLHLRAGEVAVFFPADGHMPSIQEGGPALVRKTVVKVPAG
jgi:YhcH/YjgK/YiaL family protein